MVMGECPDQRIGDRLAFPRQRIVERRRQHVKHVAERVVPGQRPDRIDQCAGAEQEDRPVLRREARLASGRPGARPTVPCPPGTAGTGAAVLSLTVLSPAAGELGHGELPEHAKKPADRRVIKGDAVEYDCANQHPGGNAAVRRIGGDHARIGHLRGR